MDNLNSCRYRWNLGGHFAEEEFSSDKKTLQPIGKERILSFNHPAINTLT
jgi:hypothetical protein